MATDTMNQAISDMCGEKQNKTFLYSFPREINFESASGYLGRLHDVDFCGDYAFDLSSTVDVHSSFIGFLIDFKRTVEAKGGDFRIKLSPALDHLFFQLDLHDYFVPNAF